MTHMSKQRRVVQVTGSGKASATPDVVRLALGVTWDGDDVSSALREVGCAGAIVGRALYDGRLDLATALESLTKPR